MAVASRHIPSTREQLSKHQEGQFEWLISVPVKSSAKGRTPRSDSHGDAEPRDGERTLYFGCNLVHRRPQSGGTPEADKSADVYTLLATRVEPQPRFSINMDAEVERLQSATANRLHLGDGMMGDRRDQALDVPRSHGLVQVKEVGEDGASDVVVSEPSRPVSRIEDSVEALDKLEEEIEALTRVAHLERVLSPEAATRSKTTPMKRATSVRAGTNSASRNKPPPTPSRGEEKAAAGGSATSPARKVPRPASLLPPKPPAKSSKAPTVSTFELPGEAVARRLKEQREQRRSQHISSEQAAALAAAYSPSKPHFKSSKPPTRPTFELPGEAISRKKREDHEAKLRAQEEEARKGREFKARPVRGSLVPGSVPRETLTSLARQKSRHLTDPSTDSAASTTITPVSQKRQSILGTAAFSRPTPSRGRDPSAAEPATAARAASAVSTASARSSGSGGKRSTATQTPTPGAATPLTPEAAAAQKVRGREVFARDNSYTAEREREKRDREAATRTAREAAAERSRGLSRLWAERQKVKREKEKGDREGSVVV